MTQQREPGRAPLTEPQRIFLESLVRYGRVRVNRGAIPEAEELVAMGFALDERPNDSASMMLVPTEAGRAAAEEGGADV